MMHETPARPAFAVIRDTLNDSDGKFADRLSRCFDSVTLEAHCLSAQLISRSPGEGGTSMFVCFRDEPALKTWRTGSASMLEAEKLELFVAKHQSSDESKQAELHCADSQLIIDAPEKWKQYLITLGAIFPTTNLVPLIWHYLLPFTTGTLMGHFLIDATVVLLMVLLWMPMANVLLHNWLFRTPTRQMLPLPMARSKTMFGRNS